MRAHPAQAVTRDRPQPEPLKQPPQALPNGCARRMVTELGAESSRLSPVLLAKCQYCPKPFAGSRTLENARGVLLGIGAARQADSFLLG